MKISTHVLDTSLGKPANGVKVELYALQSGKFELVASKETDTDGRLTDFYESEPGVELTMMKMIFNTAEYFGMEVSFFPIVEVFFSVEELETYHIPLLVGPYSYTTYRGA
jgi:5-hydroxyisourate hydrolase